VGWKHDKYIQSHSKGLNCVCYTSTILLCGGGLEHLHCSHVSSRGRQKGNPVTRWDLVLQVGDLTQGWWPCSAKKCCEIQRTENWIKSGRIFSGRLWPKKWCFAGDNDISISTCLKSAGINCNRVIKKCMLKLQRGQKNSWKCYQLDGDRKYWRQGQIYVQKLHQASIYMWNRNMHTDQDYWPLRWDFWLKLNTADDVWTYNMVWACFKNEWR
jgi:hypothetical protein